MDYKTVELELTDEQFDMFQSFQEALDHDEPEQTFSIMIRLMLMAISLTSRENHIIYLYTKDLSKINLSKIICPSCQKEVPVCRQEDDGFREGAVNLL